MVDDLESTCPNCGAIHTGEWCHACGQRRIRPEQRRMSWLVAQLVSGVTSLDSKFLRSLVALLFRPGKLGAAWLAGQRARWITPVGMFLVINLAYFVAPPLNDFNLPLRTQLEGQSYSALAVSMTESKVPGTKAWLGSPRGTTAPSGYASFMRRFEQQSGSLSKTLLILHVPLTAFALWLVHRRRKIFYVDHFAVALQFWSFLLFMMMFLPRVAESVARLSLSRGWIAEPDALTPLWKVGLLVFVVSHLVLALRRAYGQSLAVAALKAVPVFGSCVVAHLLYRPTLFALTVWTL